MASLKPVRKLRPAPPPPGRALDDEWRCFIGESILLGAAAEEIVAQLTPHGFDAGVVRGEVAAAMDNPYLRSGARLQARVAKREWALTCLAKLDHLAGGAAPPRRHRLPAETFYREHYFVSRPAVLTGLIDHWPALTRWSLDYFQAALDDPLVEVQVERESDPEYEIGADRHRRAVRWSWLLRRLREGPSNDFYLTARNTDGNRSILAPLFADVGQIEGYLTPEGVQAGFFWLGPQGTVTPFHHDLTNNLLVQVMGRKRVHLISPWEAPRMRNHVHCYSTWTPESLAAAPEAERPVMSTLVLEPGDALFIPVGWWHHVEGLDVTVSLSFTGFAADNDFFSFYRTYDRV